MRTVYQDIYDEFNCIADKCPKTCCSGWQIMIDEKSLKRYKYYQGKLKERVFKSIDFKEGAIKQKCNGDCAFLNEKGLCDWILSDGEDILCDTCRLYPRHVEEYEDVREWSVSLSCPEASRIYLNKTKPVTFKIIEDESPDPLKEEFEDFDFVLFDKLSTSREVIFNLIKDKALSMEERIAAIVEFVKKLQDFYDEGEFFLMDEFIENYDGRKEIKSKINFEEYVHEHEALFGELEILDEEWNNYCNLLNDRYSGEGSMPEILFENFLIYFFYTYYLGSVYNGMIYSYSEMCIFCTLMIDALAKRLSKKESRELSTKDYIEVTYRLTREIEHSDLNIDTILNHFEEYLDNCE